MKLRIIYNPTSGKNRRNPGLRAVLGDFIASQRLDAEICVTEGIGHATELAREAVASGCERVLAVGGDGTMNEVAQALVDSPAALALVPCGSGNGLARHLGLPAPAWRSLELAADAEAAIATLDTGVANGKRFFNAMGLGLDADVSKRFNHLVKRGLPAYVRTAWTAFRERQNVRCEIHAEGRTESVEALLVAVANSDQYGNGAIIAPHAKADDGQLNLIAIPPVTMAQAAILVARLFLGNVDRAKGVLHIKGSHFVITRSGPGPIHTDGEVHETGAVVSVSVLPRSLRIVAPAGLRFSRKATEPRASGLSYAP